MSLTAWRLRAIADIDFVVRELGANHTAEQVSRMLCERKGYAWADAQQLVARVQMQHRTSIARRLAPFLLFLGIVTLVGGLLLLGYAGLGFSSLYRAPTAAAYVRSPYAYRNMIVAFGSVASRFSAAHSTSGCPACRARASRSAYTARAFVFRLPSFVPSGLLGRGISRYSSHQTQCHDATG